MVPAQRAKIVDASGEQFVGITLVAHIPDQLVARTVEDSVQRQGQLHDAQIGRHVTAVFEDGINDMLSNLRCY